MTNVALTLPATTRPGLNIAIGSGEAPIVSEVWTLGGWTLQFVRLDAHQRHALDQRAGNVYVKVIAGRLSNNAPCSFA